MIDISVSQRKDLETILQCQINQKMCVNPVFVGKSITVEKIKAILDKIKLHT